ncbi:unnamed protein product [Cladocopium goreaui]|uniref:Uncharacterized protein n=1 Tax=Cladocopium goreaui TaxID=2562237 RepID=A0A9P1D9Z7_9DINO|nr:unnamed protein product [Cladocopium goreaui]
MGFRYQMTFIDEVAEPTAEVIRAKSCPPALSSGMSSPHKFEGEFLKWSFRPTHVLAHRFGCLFLLAGLSGVLPGIRRGLAGAHSNGGILAPATVEAALLPSGDTLTVIQVVLLGLAVTKAAVERKMKFATVLDQGDESEFTTATEEQKQLWLQSVVNQTGSAAEETGEGAGPYADFSAFLPHGGKAHRSQKYRTYIHTAFRADIEKFNRLYAGAWHLREGLDQKGRVQGDTKGCRDSSRSTPPRAAPERGNEIQIESAAEDTDELWPSGVTSPHEVDGEFLTTPAALVTHPPSVVQWRKASEMSRTQPTGGAPSDVSSPHEVEGEFLTTPAVVTHPPSIVEWRKVSKLEERSQQLSILRGACQKGADCGFCHLAHDAWRNSVYAATAVYKSFHEEARVPSFDKQQRDFLKLLPPATFLEMILPYVRKTVEESELPGAGQVLQLVESEIVVRSPGGTTVQRTPRKIRYVLERMSLANLVSLTCSTLPGRFSKLMSIELKNLCETAKILQA